MLDRMIADIPPAVLQIATRAAAQEKSIVTYRIHRVFDVHAGPRYRHDEYFLAVAAQDGHIVKARALRVIQDGKAADAAASAQVESQYEHPKPGDLLDRPFDPQYVKDYSYQQVDAQTYKFTSTVHDSGHASGTFWLDGGGNVVKYQYTPNVLPQYSTSGSVTDDRAQVLTNYWWLTREDYQYRGRVFLFSGGATAIVTYDGFKRFSNVAAATAALQDYSASLQKQ